MNRLYKTESAVSNIVGSLFLKDPFFNSIFFPLQIPDNLYGDISVK